MKVTLYTDGAARGNPDGPGGYGAVLQFVDKEGTLHEKELSAGYVKTTKADGSHCRAGGIKPAL